jgi:endonuclease/exonuclease/phosphatase family metal-dependent hydrolase
MLLRLLSYNIQVGIGSHSVRDYIVGSWRHILPHARRQEHLDLIASVAKDFDIVALQEVDGGSVRSSHINQVEYLAKKADFAFWHCQRNRNFGKFAQHSNGVLSHLQPKSISNHKLPGAVAGSGAIMLHFGDSLDSLAIVIVHCALGRRSRDTQLNYLQTLIQPYRNVILMGDFNCTAEDLAQSELVTECNLTIANKNHFTFPSWAPKRNIDHILVSPAIKIETVAVLPYQFSDHLPIAIAVEAKLEG